MKKIIILFSLAIVITSCHTSKSVVIHNETSALGRVNRSNGKIIFFYSEPVNSYEVAFTFVNSIPDIDCKTTKEIINATITNASLESGMQNKLFDGIIIGDNHRDVAITFADKTKDNAVARMNLQNGKYVFVECEPLSDYVILTKKEVSSSLGNCLSMQHKIDKLLTKAKSKADAVMFSSTKYDQVIKFTKQ